MVLLLFIVNYYLLKENFTTEVCKNFNEICGENSQLKKQPFGQLVN